MPADGYRPATDGRHPRSDHRYAIYNIAQLLHSDLFRTAAQNAVAPVIAQKVSEAKIQLNRYIADAVRSFEDRVSGLESSVQGLREKPHDPKTCSGLSLTDSKSHEDGSPVKASVPCSKAKLQDKSNSERFKCIIKPFCEEVSQNLTFDLKANKIADLSNLKSASPLKGNDKKIPADTIWDIFQTLGDTMGDQENSVRIQTKLKKLIGSKCTEVKAECSKTYRKTGESSRLNLSDTSKIAEILNIGGSKGKLSSNARPATGHSLKMKPPIKETLKTRKLRNINDISAARNSASLSVAHTKMQGLSRFVCATAGSTFDLPHPKKYKKDASYAYNLKDKSICIKTDMNTQDTSAPAKNTTIL